MKLKKMIKVMKHFKDGGTVECAETGFDEWEIAKHPCWNWSDYTYRIKKEKRVVIEKWLCQDKKGDYLIRETSNIDSYLTIKQIKLLEIYEVEV